MPTKKHTTGETAKLLDISFITLKRWIYAGKIKAEKNSDGYWLIDDDEIQRVSKERTLVRTSIENQVINLVEAKGVAYLREVQVSLEEDYLHRDTFAVLKELVPSRLQTKEKWGNRWYFSAARKWSQVKSFAAQKKKLIEAYVSHPKRFEKDATVYADYSEYLVEGALLDAGYTIVAKDAYYFNGNTYRPNPAAGRPADLDFIAKHLNMQSHIGIQIKNKLEHPKLEEVQQLLDICRKLQLRPILIARIFHPRTYDLMKSNKGMAVRCKRYFLQPPFPHETFQAIDQMGIPIGVYRRPPEFLIQSLLEIPTKITQ